MKVIHFTSSLNLGGAERFVIDLAHTQLLQHKVTPTIVSYGSMEDSLSSEAHKIGLSCYHLNSGAGRLSLLRRLHALLKRIKPDVLHVHSPAVMKSLALLLWLQPKQYQVIYTRHGANPYTHGSWKLMHKLFKPVTDVATFVSDDARTSFLQHHSWAPERCITVCNGVFVPAITARAKADETKLNIGVVGRLERIKSTEHLFEALKILPARCQSDITVHIFGTGSQKEPLQKLAATLGHIKTEFHGLVLDREKIYQTIDVQVVCSKSEGLSLAIMEGLARGVPCIATKVGGNPELIRHGENGYLYDYGDQQALAEHLRKFLQNDYPYHQLSHQAQHRISANYSLTNTQRQYTELYSVKRPHQA